MSFSKQLSPIPAIPEPQVHPYWVIKGYGKCHAYKAKFDKKKTTIIKESDGLVAKGGQNQVN